MSWAAAERLNEQHAGAAAPLLTEGLLAHDEAAEDLFVGAPQREAVPSEDDVKGLCNVNKGQMRAAGGSCATYRILWPSRRSPFTQTLDGSTLRISVHDRFNICRTEGGWGGQESEINTSPGVYRLCQLSKTD